MTSPGRRRFCPLREIGRRWCPRRVAMGSPAWLTRAPRTLYPHTSGTEHMILPQTYDVVLVLMILSLICLGSWASMFKLAGKWRFELFYFDFAVGLALAAVIFAFTVGNLGFDGFNFLDDLQHAGKRQWLFGFLAGVIFNFANMLLMAAVSVAGMSIAFPMCIAISVLVGTGIAALSHSLGNTMLVALGCLLL